jgi:hypothetical protein
MQHELKYAKRSAATLKQNNKLSPMTYDRIKTIYIRI